MSQENLSQALKEFKRDKINRQNARLSLVNSLYENPSMPRRKILLSVGANNYRPPMERSKSAPKLMAIEEAVGEEEEAFSMPSFKKHSLYSNEDFFTASTFDRKYAKRNRTFNRCKSAVEHSKSRCTPLNGCIDSANTEIAKTSSSLYDDDDEFNHLLMTNDYDVKSSLSGEILSYLDTKLGSSSSLCQSTIDSHPNGLGDEEADSLTNENQNDAAGVQGDFDSYNSADSYCNEENEAFNQGEVLNSLVMASGRIDCVSDMKSGVANSGNFTKTNETTETNLYGNVNGNAIAPFILDSDEGSITSGCETSSIITTAHIDELMKSEREIDAITLSLSRLPLKQPTANLEKVLESEQATDRAAKRTNEEDSEFSDESGFDENNIVKMNHFRCNRSSGTSGESTCNADANNNVKHTFSSNTPKAMGRLRINIPKNAKSIDI